METVLIVSDIYIINESLNSFFSNDYKFKNIIIKDDLAKVEFEELKTIDLLIVNVKSKSYNELFRYIDYKSKFNLEVKIVALDLCGDYKFFLKIMNSNINGYLLDIDNKEELLSSKLFDAETAEIPTNVIKINEIHIKVFEFFIEISPLIQQLIHKKTAEHC